MRRGGSPVVAVLIVAGALAAPVAGAPVAGGAEPKDAPKRTVEFTIAVKFRITGAVTELRLIHLVPRTLHGRQDIGPIAYSREPSRLFTRGPNKYAEFVIADPKDGLAIRLRAKAVLHKHKLSGPGRAKSPTTRPDEQRPADYLRPEKYIESDDERIRRIAAKLRRPAQLETIRACFDYTTRALDYDVYNPDSVGAVASLATRTGDCTEYSDLMVALCRAAGIPARVIDGYLIGAPVTPNHNWVEVHSDAFGWVPFDPTAADGGAASFESLDNRYIYLSCTRNDRTLDGGHRYYYSYTFRRPGEPSVAAKDTFTVRDLPSGEAEAGPTGAGGK